MGTSQSSSASASSPTQQPDVSSPQIRFSELKHVEAIAEGGFGVVHRAKHPLWGTVVYKELKSSIIADGSKAAIELQNEAKSHKLDHVNVVKLYAMVFERNHYGVVLEYVPNGGLDVFLSVNSPVDWWNKLFLAHSVVCGMEYLHSIQPHPVIHGDLKLENVLVGDGLIAKVCDFGLAKWKEYSQSNTNSRSNRAGTVTHIPPEIWIDINNPRTVKYDVYSFAVLLWELFTEEKPFKTASNHEQIKLAVKDGQRPDLDAITGPETLVNSIKDCITYCWHQSPDMRPSFADVNQSFTRMREISDQQLTRSTVDLVRRLTYTERRLAAGVTTLNDKIFVVYYKSPFIVVNRDVCGCAILC